MEQTTTTQWSYGARRAEGAACRQRSSDDGLSLSLSLSLYGGSQVWNRRGESLGQTRRADVLRPLDCRLGSSGATPFRRSGEQPQTPTDPAQVGARGVHDSSVDRGARVHGGGSCARASACGDEPSTAVCCRYCYPLVPTFRCDFSDVFRHERVRCEIPNYEDTNSSERARHPILSVDNATSASTYGTSRDDPPTRARARS